MADMSAAAKKAWATRRANAEKGRIAKVDQTLRKMQDKNIKEDQVDQASATTKKTARRARQIH